MHTNFTVSITINTDNIPTDYLPDKDVSYRAQEWLLEVVAAESSVYDLRIIGRTFNDRNTTENKIHGYDAHTAW